VLDLLQVLNPALIPPPAQVLDAVAFDVTYAVTMDEIDRLDGEAAVMGAANLRTLGAHASTTTAKANSDWRNKLIVVSRPKIIL
jgi:hypothetical protein